MLLRKDEGIKMKDVKMNCPVCSQNIQDDLNEDTIVACPICGHSIYISEIKHKEAKGLGFNLEIIEDKINLNLNPKFDFNEDFEDDFEDFENF